MIADEARRRSGFAGWWDGLGRAQRVAAVVVALVIGVNVALAALGSAVGGDPGGPVSSSFSTGADGLQAWSELLARSDHPVTRLREPLAETRLARDATVVVADPGEVSLADQRRLARFVADGGRLVVVGRTGETLLRTVTGADVYAGQGARGIATWVPVPETTGVTNVAGGTGAMFSIAPPMVGVAGDPSNTTTSAVDGGPAGAAVLVADIGRGRVVAVADASVLQNESLGRADNAALALGVVGLPGRPILFDEAAHGFAASGLAALPSNWRWAGAGLAVAVLAGLWSAGSRFGAAEPVERTLRPPRVEHVAAVAADLDRVSVSYEDVVGPLAASTRAAFATRVGAPPDASPAVLHAAADRMGMAPEAIATVVAPVTDLAHALAVGALAAERQRAERGVASPAGAQLTATVPADPTPGGPPS